MSEKTKEEIQKEERDAYELDHAERNARVANLKVFASKDVLSQEDIQAALKLLLSTFR